MLAVGGYGRRELFPHSDIDLLLLVERMFTGESSETALSAFLRIFGITVCASANPSAASPNAASSISTTSNSASVCWTQRFLIGDQRLI